MIVGSWFTRRITQSAIAGVVVTALTFWILNSRSSRPAGNLFAAGLFASLGLVDLGWFGLPKWAGKLCFWLAVAWLTYWFWSIRPPIDDDGTG